MLFDGFLFYWVFNMFQLSIIPREQNTAAAARCRSLPLAGSRLIIAQQIEGWRVTPELHEANGIGAIRGIVLSARGRNEG